MEGEFPGEEVMAAMEATEVNGNPLGIGYASRGDWAEELGVKPLAEDPEVDVLYFVGCYASFDKRNIAVARSFVKLCQAAGVKVGILGKEEKCCGEPMRKMGNEYLYQTMAMETVEVINGVRGEEDRHHLPALLQHPCQGLPRFRPRGRGGDRIPSSLTGCWPRAGCRSKAEDPRLHLPRFLLSRPP